MAVIPVSKSTADKTKSRVAATNYKAALNAMENARFNEYVPIKSSKAILKELSVAPDISDKNKEKFFETLVSLFQSMTTEAFTTFEIVDHIADELDKFGDDKQKVIEFLEKSYTIVHTDYSGKINKLSNVERILFNHFKEDDYGAYTDLGYRLIGINNRVNRDIKTLCISKKENIISQISQASNNKLTSSDVEGQFNSYYNNININKKIKNPSKNFPSFSSIMITNPDIKVGSRNSLELATFFNSVSNIEFNRAYPYFNAEFIIPNYSKQDINAVMKAATINQFIHGSLKPSKTTSNYKSMEGKRVLRDDIEDKKKSQVGKIIKTNMSLFTTPQTMVNLDEEIGHSSNASLSTRSLRLTSVNDSTQPFMTINNISINVAPTKGLMSFKTGKINLTLHDRKRLPDIAPFVKYDLFGSFGAEIILEYGWSHMDEKNPSLNPVGAFIGNSKTKEVYMITNSSFSMDQSGLISIDLSISMKGASLLKNTEISFIADNRLKSQVLKSPLATIESCRQSLKLSSYNVGILTSLNNSDLLNPVKKIDAGLSKSLIEFVALYSFLKEENLTSNYTLVALPDNKGFKINIAENNTLVDNKFKFLSLIFGDRINSTNYEQEAIINNSELDAVGVTENINGILNAYRELREISNVILKQDILEVEVEAAVLESLVGGIEFVDPFYPANDNFIDKIKDPASFVSFGAIVNSLLQTHVLQKIPVDFDEIQTYFYTANKFAAGMKDKNLSTFLIPKTELKEFIKKEIKNRNENTGGKTGKGITLLTLESLISQIINKFIKTKNNIMYGVSDLYKIDENNNVTAKEDDQEKHANNLSRKLHKIYYPDEEKIDTEKNDVTFKVPSIKFSFDALTSDSVDQSQSKTILRVSIYDQSDSPFDATSSILEKLYTEDLKKSVESIRKIKTNFENKGAKTLYENKIKNEIKLLEDKKFIKNVNGKYIFNPFHTKIENKSKTVTSIKNYYKEIFPSLTFGTQHTPILSANVSTVNENKLNTVYITRSDRNNQSELNSRIKPDLPLRIMPVQASVETFGCPWVNFGQFIFIDFDTGTTMDNKYGVSGITHNLAPGKFTTSLTLAYGDVYGQYEQAVNLIESVTSTLNSKKNDIVDVKSKTLKATNNKDIKIIGESFRRNSNNKKYIVNLNFEPDKDPKTKIEIDNELYFDNYSKFINLMIYNNTFANNFFVNKSKETINSLIAQSKTKSSSQNLFPIVFKEEFKKNKTFGFNVYFKENPLVNKPFVFNIFNKTKDKLKNNPSGINLIIGQYNNSNSIVDIISPKLLNETTQFDFVDYNKINTKMFDNFKKSLEVEINNTKDNSKINRKNLSISKLVYENILNLIDKAYKESGNSILSLRIRSLSLYDVIQKDFSQNNKDTNDFWGLFESSSTSEKIAEREDLFRQKIKVKATKGQKINAGGVKPVYLPPSEAKTFYRNKKLEQASTLAGQSSILEFNLNKLKNLFNSSDEIKLKSTRFQNFNIFKSLKVTYDSSAQIEFSAQPAAKAELKKHEAFKIYEVSLNKNVINDIKQISPIYDISVLGNKTSNARIQISVKKITPEKGADNFVEYKEQTAPNISIIEPEFDFISIFDPNYILDNSQIFSTTKKFIAVVPQGISKGIVQTGNDAPDKSQRPARIDRESKTDEYQDEMVASDNVEYIEYTIPVSQLVDHIKDKTYDLFNGSDKNLLVYSHKQTKKDDLGKLGNSIFVDKSSIIDDKIKAALKNMIGFEKYIPITDEKFNGSAYAISLDKNKNYNPFKGTIDDNNSITWNLKLNNANNVPGQIVEATNEEYRNIKLSNLPAVNKQNLNLKVMDPWVPTPSTTGFDLTGDTNLAFVEKANITNVNAQYLAIASTVVDAKDQLNKQYQNSHVEFESIINTAAKNLSYLDYKVSDLDIQYQTPDKVESKVNVEGRGASIKTLTYSSNIINNKKRIGLTRQRRTKIQPRLFGILFKAMQILQQSQYSDLFDVIFIRTGGDIPLYSVNSRNLSKTIRHDSGYAVDIQIKKSGKAIGLTANAKPNTPQFKHNNLIWFYLKTCKELGATGIGADYDYDKGKAFHIDIAKDNPDFKTDKYKRAFKVNLKGVDTTITQAQINRSINSIVSVRYWGKHDQSGGFKKESAPVPLKDIFK